jgi:hypothetical protein
MGVLRAHTRTVNYFANGLLTLLGFLGLLYIGVVIKRLACATHS